MQPEDAHTFVEDVSEQYKGYATLHKTPLMNPDDSEIESDFWVISSVNNVYGDETMVFPAFEDGSAVRWRDVFYTSPANHTAALVWIEERAAEAERLRVGGSSE